MTDLAHDRHLTWPNVLEYLTAGAPAIIPVKGAPSVRLVIDPAEERIAVRGPWPGKDTVPDLTTYRHLDTRVGADADGDWVEFAASGREVLEQAYAVLVAAADRVQLHGDDMAVAIRRVLDSYHEILSSLGRLSDNQELGLYGELLILDHLIDSVGDPTAVTSWRGPLSEEHDFGLEDLDIEVKTTLSEQRHHRISTLTQLEPSPGRPLWLVSIQLTTGGVAGSTLPERITATRERLSDSVAIARFAETLASLRWNHSQSHLYTRRFALRSHILTFEIKPAFPALTTQRLQAAGLPTARFTHVSYILNVAGLPHDIPPSSLQGLNTQ